VQDLLGALRSFAPSQTRGVPRAAMSDLKTAPKDAGAKAVRAN